MCLTSAFNVPSNISISCVVSYLDTTIKNKVYTNPQICMVNWPELKTWAFGVYSLIVIGHTGQMMVSVNHNIIVHTKSMHLQLRPIYHADLRSSVYCIMWYLQPNPTPNATDVIRNKHANRIPNEAVSIFGAGVGVSVVVVVGGGVVL